MQEKANKQKRMADEMDINLEVFNLETDFFGDLHCSSRFTDMLCDAQAQYGDYEPRNTGTGTCFAEKGIELQAEMSVAQFFCKFLHFDLVGKNYFTIFAGGKGI